MRREEFNEDDVSFTKLGHKNKILLNRRFKKTLFK